MGENAKKLGLVVVILVALVVIGLTAMSMKKQSDFAQSQLPTKPLEGFGKGPIVGMENQPAPGK